VFHIANLEGVLTQRGKPYFPEQQFSLRMPLELAMTLKENQINYVTRANNHSMDFGIEGLQETNQLLKAQKINWIGVGADLQQAIIPLVLEKNNIKLAIFSFTTTQPYKAWANSKRPGVAAPAFDEIIKIIQDAKSKYDFVVVVYHWGTELDIIPHEQQIGLARALVKTAKVDLIIGHHAHVAQKIEKVKDVWIVYGLGNFIFTSTSQKSKVSIMSAVEFCKEDESKRISPFFIPLDTLNSKNPHATKPYTVDEFLIYGKEYFDKKIFDENAIFYFPWEQKKYSVSSLLKLKNGRHFSY
jgi:poly-gamma-glutamate synthesis protein (capsule biosynthesis protein)